MLKSIFLVGAVLGGVFASHMAAAGRLEVPLRESDTVFFGTDPFELVIRVPGAPAAAARVDVAWIEFGLDVSGEPDTFVPFVVVADAVAAGGQPGQYESVWAEAARELVLRPGSGQALRLDATRLVRRWRATGGEMNLRIRVVDPPEAVRPSDSIRLVATNGSLGRAVLVVR